MKNKKAEFLNSNMKNSALELIFDVNVGLK